MALLPALLPLAQQIAPRAFARYPQQWLVACAVDRDPTWLRRRELRRGDRQDAVPQLGLDPIRVDLGAEGDHPRVRARFARSHDRQESVHERELGVTGIHA